MAKVFTFTKSPCSVDRLTLEIRSSLILVALDYINLFGSNLDIFFKADLSSNDVTLLNAIVAAHSGEPMPEEEAKSIAIGTQYGSYDPAPSCVEIGKAPISVDANKKLMTRGTVITDEGSFRDCFKGTSLFSELSGTFSFSSESDQIVGSGDFSKIPYLTPYIKLKTDSDSCFTQGEVKSVSNFTLYENYKGSSGDGAAVISNWYPIQTEDASISVENSDIILSSGIINGSIASIYKKIDYLPIRFQAKLEISQRIANQQIEVGLSNLDNSIHAKIIFDGTDNTKLRFCTNNGGIEIEETECIIPFNKKTSEELTYCIEVVSNSCCLLINEVILATHHDFIPDSYDMLGCLLSIANTGIATSSTNVICDWVSCQNVNQIDIINSFSTVPVKTKLISPAALDGKPLVSTTCRPVGTYTYVSSKADSQEHQSKIADGINILLDHKIGDSIEQIMYFDINSIDNETHLHTAVLQWSNALFDDVHCMVVPKVTVVSDGVGTNYTTINGILVATPPGYGNKTVDWNTVNLVEMVTNEFGMKPAGYWDATYNTSSKIFENITFNSAGTGQFNIFVSEIIFSSFVPSFIMLNSNIYEIKSNDESRLGHNMRIKIIATTHGDDHVWQFCAAVNLFRKKTC